MSETQKSKKTWKDALLSSGMPLEHSVKEILKGFGILAPTEFAYSRKCETGLPKLFSIDIQASQQKSKELTIELLIECKYRRDGTIWVFAPDEPHPAYIKHRSPFPVVNVIHNNVSVSSRHLQNVIESLPFCGRGVEMKDNIEVQPVREAIQQIRFAVAPKVAEQLLYQLREDTDGNPISVVLPFVVTTANLWRIKPNVGIEAIRAAKELAEVANPVSSLMLHEEPDGELDRHNDFVFQERLTSNGVPVLPLAGIPEVVQFRADFSINQPWLVFVVHYSHLKQLLQKIFEVIYSDGFLITPHSKQ